MFFARFNLVTVEIRILVGVRNATDARHQEMDHLILRMDKMKVVAGRLFSH